MYSGIILCFTSPLWHHHSFIINSRITFSHINHPEHLIQFFLKLHKLEFQPQQSSLHSEHFSPSATISWWLFCKLPIQNGISSCLLFNQHLQPALIKQPGRYLCKQTKWDFQKLFSGDPLLSCRFLFHLPAFHFKAGSSHWEHNNERGHGAPVVHERCENLLQMRQEQ